MQPDRKYEPKKEKRDWYFVEYHPANYYKFANLNLVLLYESANETEIVSAMEKEANYWLGLYPVPLMVSIFDNLGDLYRFSGEKEKRHLIAFLNKHSEMELHWEMLKDDEIPDTALDREYINKIYSNFSYTTYSHLKSERETRRRKIEDWRFVLLLWITLTAFVAEIFIYFNDLLSLLAFLFVLFKAIQKILQFANMWPKSKRKKKEEEEQGLKDHYYYHCRMNPEGFERLRRENFEKMAKEEIQKEAKSIDS